MLNWFRKLPDWVRRPLRTFAAAFFTLFGAALVGWLMEVQQWASCIEQCESFPDAGVLAKAAVAGVTAGLIGVVNLVWNLLEDKTKFPAVLKAPPSSGENPVP